MAVTSSDVLYSSFQTSNAAVFEKYGIKNEASELSLSEHGENYDPDSGQISFEKDDLVIPGNSGLEITIARSYDYDHKIMGLNGYFGKWSLKIPHIRTTMLHTIFGPKEYSGSWGQYKECSGTLRPTTFYAYFGSVPNDYDAESYWNGDFISIPGYGENLILKNSLGAKTTKNNFKISCIDRSEPKASGGFGEGFYVETPDGMKYTFSERKNVSKSLASGPVQLYSVFMLVTKIEDRFGNSINYNYSNGLLESISSSDGRFVSFRYVNVIYKELSNGQFRDKEMLVISQVESDGKIFQYNYYDNTNAIESVVYPDGSMWNYSKNLYQGRTGAVVVEANNTANCTLISNDNPTVNFQISNSFGGVWDYTLKKTIHGIAHGPNKRPSPGTVSQKCYGTYSLVKKEISYLGSSNLVWEYKYSQNSGSYHDNTPSVLPIAYRYLGTVKSLPRGVDVENFKSTVVTYPDGNKEIHFIDRNYRSISLGKVIAIDTYDGDSLSLVRRVDSSYSQGYYIGDSDLVTGLKLRSNFYDFFVKKRTLVFGAEADSEYVVEYSDFDQYGYSKIVKSYNDQVSDVEYRKVDYFHDVANWILGLTKKTYLSSSSVFNEAYKEFIYNSQALPYQEMLFNRLLKTHSYHSDGNLYRTTFNGSNRYEQFEDYYRGRSRKITLPCAITNGCNTVNGSTTNSIVALLDFYPSGHVKSVTDFKGNKISYSYNPLGWLTKVDFADSKWKDKIISYAAVSVLNDGVINSGVPVGSLRQTITQGNYKKNIYHDGLLRRIFTSEQDVQESDTIRYQTYSYDHENRRTFTSFLSSDAANRIGLLTDYDMLGRIESVVRTSDNSKTLSEYLTGNRVATTDALGNITTTTFLAYGEPAYDYPISIEAPDSDDTSIKYNIYGQVETIAQGNITETRLYDTKQQLCKVIRPETGITAYDYNAQGQPIWQALGTAGSVSACDLNSVPYADKTFISYNNLGVINGRNFSDNTPDLNYIYDDNGNVTTLQAGNIIWNYEYNSLNAIDKEMLRLDEKIFVLDWQYNSLGAVSSLTYPSGAIVDFEPNALGQATKAANYATNVKYHPNGQIKKFVYGNGIVRDIALDTTGRIDSIIDKKGISLVNLDPSYDENDNLDGLIDWVDSSKNISNLRYDGVNRLLDADGVWGIGKFSYDGIGNIKSKIVNGDGIHLHYNADNRLNNVSGNYSYTYNYDKRGNVINNGRYGLIYNAGQQLVSAKGISYLYDGNNRRVRKSRNSFNSYSVYSLAGTLFHRVSESGVKTDSIYLGNNIVAEVDDPEPITQQPKPIVTISVNQILLSRNCPPKTVCTTGLMQYAHEIEWYSTNSISCNGTIQSYYNSIPLGTKIISGVTGTTIQDKNGTVYNISLTCTGAGGSTTVTTVASGNGPSEEF